MKYTLGVIVQSGSNSPTFQKNVLTAIVISKTEYLQVIYIKIRFPQNLCPPPIQIMFLSFPRLPFSLALFLGGCPQNCRSNCGGANRVSSSAKPPD
jgi:hypothetical protein